MIFEEVLVLVHGVVGVHVFGIGRALIGCGIALARLAGVG